MHMCSKYVKNKILITRNSLRSGSAQYQQCLLGPIPNTHTHTHTKRWWYMRRMLMEWWLAVKNWSVVSMRFVILNPHF